MTLIVVATTISKTYQVYFEWEGGGGDFSPTAIDATWPLATYLAKLSEGVKKGYFSQFYFLVRLNNIEILGMNVGTIVYYA